MIIFYPLKVVGRGEWVKMSVESVDAPYKCACPTNLTSACLPGHCKQPLIHSPGLHPDRSRTINVDGNFLYSIWKCKNNLF